MATAVPIVLGLQLPREAALDPEGTAVASCQPTILSHFWREHELPLTYHMVFEGSRPSLGP